MGRLLVIGVTVLGACDARLGAMNSIDASTPPDVPVVPPDMNMNPPPDTGLGAWSPPQQINGAADATNSEDDSTLSSTATELYYAVSIPNSTTGKDLYVMTRATANDPWGPPQALTAFNTTGTEESPRLSPDDLTLYFGRGGDIFTSTRGAVGGAWSTPVSAGAVNTTAYEKWFAVCNGDIAMVSRFNATSNSQDLYQGTVTDGAPNLVAELSSASSEISTFLSADCYTVYFASNRLNMQTQIYTSTRTSLGGPWTTPTMVPSPFADGSDDEDPWVSADNRTFVFASIRGAATTKDLYYTTR